MLGFLFILIKKQYNHVICLFKLMSSILPITTFLFHDFSLAQVIDITILA